MKVSVETTEGKDYLVNVKRDADDNIVEVVVSVPAKDARAFVTAAWRLLREHRREIPSVVIAALTQR